MTTCWSRACTCCENGCGERDGEGLARTVRVIAVAWEGSGGLRSRRGGRPRGLTRGLLVFSGGLGGGAGGTWKPGRLLGLTSTSRPGSSAAARARPLFPSVSLTGAGVPAGHNRTRPPPCMRWRGPCSTCRSRLATAPSSTGSDGPTAGASHPLPVPVSRFPSAFPRGFPLGWCPFPTWVYFYSCVPARRKRPGEATEISFLSTE